MKRIAIFGAGTMGLGIAQSAVQDGLEVKLFDIFSKNPGMLEKAQRKLWLSLFLEKDKNKKLLYRSKEEVDEAFGRVMWLENSEENMHVLKVCDAVIEAVFEDEDVKKTLYTDVEVDYSPDGYAKITFGDGAGPTSPRLRGAGPEPSRQGGSYGAGNFLSTELVKKIREALKSVKERGGVKAVFIKGAGKNFSSGANVKEFPLCFHDQKFAEEAIISGCGLMDEINEFPCPVIAVIEGKAMGGAYELALACDYIVAKEGSIVQLPEVGLGILPGWGGTQKLPRRAGLGKGLQMILTAQPVYAQPPFVDLVAGETNEDYLQHFVEVTPPSLEAVSRAKKRKFKPLTYSWPERKGFIFALIKSWLGWKLQFRTPPKSFYLAAKATYDGNKKNISWGLLEERKAILDALKTHDAEEGIRSFLEKRRAKFENN